MPFAIVQHETVNMNVDAIVNTADSESSIAYGCNARFYQKAGLQLLKQRKKIGTISLGDAAVTPAYDLKAKYEGSDSKLFLGGYPMPVFMFVFFVLANYKLELNGNL